MKKENNLWIDGNRNAWDASVFTEKEAIGLSESLTDCSNCSDCSDCRDCSNCRYCRYCRYCSNCRYCRYCSNCSNCRYCRYCSNCSNCSDCSNCRDFTQNPKRIVSGLIGSRKATTTAYWVDNNIQVVCGCFRGNLDDFEARVIETHGDNQHAKDYLKFISNVRDYINKTQ